MKIVADSNMPFVAECFSSIGKTELVAAEDITTEVVKDADILLVRSVTQVDRNLLEGSKVRFVGTATIGYDHVDIEYLKKKGIGFASAAGCNSNAVAEYVVCALLEMSGKLGLRLEGSSIGIIGVGNVGSKVAKKCTLLGMEVFLNDPPLKRKTDNSKYQPLEELHSCDFVTIHTPLTFDGIDKTYHLADNEFFDSLKIGCVFLNTSRGGVVDSGALKDAIAKNKLGAVVLDVWEGEPDIDIDLLKKVDLATPHIAGYSFEGKVNGTMMVYRTACQYFGFKTEFNEKDFLPKTENIEFTIENRTDEQEVLAHIVKKVYDIGADDLQLRGILDVDKEHRDDYFNGLRKEYRVRKEFANIELILQNAGNEILQKLSSIGFEKLRTKS